jgi:hypothetical protein
MTKSILTVMAVLVLTIATTNSAIVHSPSRYQRPSDQANNDIESDDPKYDVRMQLNSITRGSSGRKILSDVDASGLQKDKAHIVNYEAKMQVLIQGLDRISPSKINPRQSRVSSKVMSAKESANEPAKGNRLMRDIVFTAPPEVFTTIAPKIKTTRPEIIVIQTPAGTTPEPTPAITPPATGGTSDQSTSETATTFKHAVTGMKETSPQPSTTEAEETETETEEEMETSATAETTPQPSTTEAEETETETGTEEETETSANDATTPPPSTTEAEEETETAAEDETETAARNVTTTPPSTTEAEGSGETETAPIEDHDVPTTTKDSDTPETSPIIQ